MAASTARDVVRDDLGEVFRRDYRRVVAVAGRVLGSRDECEDVAQEVFLAFGRSTVPADEASGWLTVAAVHTALNHLRSGRRRASREESAAVSEAVVRPTTSPDVADVVVTAEERSRVRDRPRGAPREAGRRPGPPPQRAVLRRGRDSPLHVPRQRRHDRATRRVRTAQGVERSCVIRMRACCAAWSTSRPAWPTPTAHTSPTARSASSRWPMPATTPPPSAPRSAPTPWPTPSPTSTSTPPGLG